jgi:cytochrome c oxidase subunit 1
MPRRIYTYPEGMGWNLWNAVETVGAFIIAVSVLVFIVNAIVSRSRGTEAGDDPWDGRTVEWMTSSPPPEHNFNEIPLVTSRDEFWHRKYVETPEGEPARVFAGGEQMHEDHSSEEHSSEEHDIHMPSPSYFPILAAAGIPLLGYGAMYSSLRPLIVVGAFTLVLGLYGWVLEPGTEEA